MINAKLEEKFILCDHGQRVYLGLDERKNVVASVNLFDVIKCLFDPNRPFKVVHERERFAFSAYIGIRVQKWVEVRENVVDLHKYNN